MTRHEQDLWIGIFELAKADAMARGMSRASAVLLAYENANTEITRLRDAALCVGRAH